MTLRRTALTTLLAATCSAGLALSAAPPAAHAVGEGPSCCTNGTVNTNILHTYDEMVSFLKKQDTRQPRMQLEVIGKSVKGRDLHLVKYLSDPSKPTVLFLTQQHGNEQLTTEASLDFIKNLGGGKAKGMLDNVNILILPMLNPDGAMGDVNFPLDDYIASGDRHLTRYNAEEVDLNRDHVAQEQPETKALHNNVLSAYPIDYMVDFHHQGTKSEVGGRLVSGSILHPTSPSVSAETVEGSKRLGSVVYNAIQPTGWGHLGKYVGGTNDTIGRNGIAAQYDISTLLFEMRGMSDHEYEDYVLGQRSNGYLIKQSVVTMAVVSDALATGAVESADTGFWDTLPEPQTRDDE